MIEIPMEVSASDVEIPAELSISVPPSSHFKRVTMTVSGSQRAMYIYLDDLGIDFVPRKIVAFALSTSRSVTQHTAIAIEWDSETYGYLQYVKYNSTYKYNGIGRTGAKVSYFPPGAIPSNCITVGSDGGTSSYVYFATGTWTILAWD